LLYCFKKKNTSALNAAKTFLMERQNSFNALEI